MRPDRPDPAAEDLAEGAARVDAVQIEAVLTLIERLRGRASVVFVSHRLDEVLRVCDRVYVMNNGRCVAQRQCRGCDPAELKRLIMGHDTATGFSAPPPRAPTTRSAPARVNVRALSRAGCYRSVSFELHAGEVLGIAGAGGLGRTLIGVLTVTVLRVGIAAMGFDPAYEPITYGVLVVAAASLTADRAGRIRHR